MTSDESSAASAEATRLEVNVYPAEDRNSGPAPDIDDDEMDRVAELIEEHGFYLAEDSYDMTLLTTAFVSNAENVEKIEAIVATLEDWYPEETVDYTEAARANNTTSDIFPVTQMVTVEKIRESPTEVAENNEEEVGDDEGCPECGGNVAVDEENGNEERVCEECGLVVEDETVGDGPDWRAFPTTDRERVEPADRSDWDTDGWNVDAGAPDGEVIVGYVSEPHRTEHAYYRIDNAAEFFGDAWQNHSEMTQKINEAGLEPFRSVSLPNADWVIPD